MHLFAPFMKCLLLYERFELTVTLTFHRDCVFIQISHSVWKNLMIVNLEKSWNFGIFDKNLENCYETLRKKLMGL